MGIKETIRDFRQSEKSTYLILQLKGGDETRYERFEPYEYLTLQGKYPDIGHYNAVFVGTETQEHLEESKSKTQRLERLYEQFNVALPDGFSGHSLSVSDVVALKTDGKISFHYVDAIGFMELFDFYTEKDC